MQTPPVSTTVTMNPQPNLESDNPEPMLKEESDAGALTKVTGPSGDDAAEKSTTAGGSRPAGEAVVAKGPPAVALPSNSNATPKSTKRIRKTKDGEASDKPRRPLSAYNYFFKENRAVLLAERDEKLKLAKEEGDEKKEEAESGYGFFGTMAKVIAQRWKAITKEELEGYKKKAEEDSKRYRDQMEDYNLRKRMAAKMADSPKKGKKTSKAKALFKKNASKAMRHGMNPVAVEDPRGLAGAGGPTSLTMQEAQMLRFGRPAATQADMVPQLMGAGHHQQQQLDMETQLMLLQQQRQLEAMGLITQSTRPALFGVSSQYGIPMLGTGMVGVGGGIQQQFLFDQAGVPAVGFAGAGQAAVGRPMNDMPFSSRMDAYAQHEQEAALFRQQMLAPMSAPQDPGYANLLLQLRLQEQEERMRNQAFAMGQGRW